MWLNFTTKLYISLWFISFYCSNTVGPILRSPAGNCTCNKYFLCGGHQIISRKKYLIRNICCTGTIAGLVVRTIMLSKATRRRYRSRFAGPWKRSVVDSFQICRHFPWQTNYCLSLIFSFSPFLSTRQIINSTFPWQLDDVKAQNVVTIPSH